MCNHVSLCRQQRPPPASASATVAGSGWAGKAATARRPACRKAELKGIRKQGGTCGRRSAAARLAARQDGNACGLFALERRSWPCATTSACSYTRSHVHTHQQQRGIWSSQVPWLARCRHLQRRQRGIEGADESVGLSALCLHAHSKRRRGVHCRQQAGAAEGRLPGEAAAARGRLSEQHASGRGFIASIVHSRVALRAGHHGCRERLPTTGGKQVQA